MYDENIYKYYFNNVCTILWKHSIKQKRFETLYKAMLQYICVCICIVAPDLTDFLKKCNLQNTNNLCKLISFIT